MSAGAEGERAFGGGRFRARRRLGAGGFGVVWECFDRDRLARVALKTLARGESDALLRFKREFRALADLHHPNLVQLYELFADGDEWFFTMELVDGVDFVSFARGRGLLRGASLAERRHDGPPVLDDDELPTAPSTTLVLPPSLFPESVSHLRVGSDAARVRAAYRESELRATLRQLSEGVVALHRSGTLHRDLKPRNVLVGTLGESTGRVVVLDFGLAADVELGPRVRDAAVVGTPAYMAPEVAAGESASSASDWYSVGVMLYEALVGALPFAGTAAEILDAKQRFAAPRPSERVLDAAADLAELCEALLCREPSERPRGDDVLARLGVPAERARATMSLPPASGPFVGRAAELARFDEAYADARAGQTAVVLIRGRTGIGKTSFARRCLDSVRRRDPAAIVLSGRCFPRESLPFKAFDAIIDALARRLPELPATIAGSVWPREAAALVRLFPVLDAVMPASVDRQDAALDAREVRQRGAAGLRALLAAAAALAPVVVSVDDLQWGDADSAALLHEVLRAPPPAGILLLATVRTEDEREAHVVSVLRALAATGLPVRTIELGALDVDESRALASLHLGPRLAASAAFETIVNEARGDPFLLGEIAEHVRGAAVSEAMEASLAPEIDEALADDELELPTRRASVPPARWLDELIRQRLRRLPEPAQRLLEVIAAFGAPIARATARRAAQLDDDEQAALIALSAGNFIRASNGPDGERLEAYHERVREVVRGSLDERTRRARHARLARTLEADGADPETIGRHLIAAGEAERALVFLSEAAERASRALAFVRAAALLDDALALRPADASADPALRAGLERRRGEALQNAGRGLAAAAAFEASARILGGVAAIDLRRRAAEQLMLGGQLEAGLGRMRAIFAELDLAWPKTAIGAIGSVLLSRAAIRARGESAVRPGVVAAPRDRARIDALWSAATMTSLVDPLFAGELAMRHLRVALGTGEAYRISRAYALAALYATVEGEGGLQRAERWIDAARAAHTHDAQPDVDALATIAAGYLAAMQGQWRAAAVEADLAVELLRLRCVGARWANANANILSLLAHRVMGELHTLRIALPAQLAESIEIGDRVQEIMLRMTVSAFLALCRDEVELARAEVASFERWPSPPLLSEPPSFAWCHHLIESLAVELYAGEIHAAEERLSRATDALGRASVAKLPVLRMSIAFHRGSIGAALALEPADAARGIAHLEAATHELAALGTATTLALANVLRATRAFVERRPRDAEPFLARAEDAFVALEMGMHAEAVRAARGEIDGGADGSRRRAAALSALRSRGVVRPQQMLRLFALPWLAPKPH
jgi:serine/threonine protein kinase